MILIDTNVVSETMRPRPDQRVIAWLNETETVTLYVSTITIAEIESGIEILPFGERRLDLERRFRRFIDEGFAQRVLHFDTEAARSYARIMSHRRSVGRPLASLDGQIASIAQSKGCALATRNVADFSECGLKVVNPFDPR
ncbi:MAG: PIN domain-containing protein [Spirochaetes bacterium]|jgi:predicted nucleic acid-binding protein|nr:PIN domain-containing protein [Spirochaetota bacterium]